VAGLAANSALARFGDWLCGLAREGQAQFSAKPSSGIKPDHLQLVFTADATVNLLRKVTPQTSTNGVTLRAANHSFPTDC
jgi:hypothetical protein